ILSGHLRLRIALRQRYFAVCAENRCFGLVCDGRHARGRARASNGLPPAPCNAADRGEAMTLGRATRRSFIAGAAAACTGAAAPASGGTLITGVNLSGLELNGRRLPGRLDHDFAAPTEAELDYYRACGARCVRLPFLWERLQPELNGAFDPDYG